MRPGTTVKVITTSRYQKHLDKVDFVVTQLLPNDRIEVIATDHPAITCLSDNTYSVNPCPSMRIPKNTLSGATYVFASSALAPADIWQKAKALQEKTGMTMLHAISAVETDTETDTETPQKSDIPEKMHRIKKAFSKRNIFKAIRDIAGRNLAYDGQYVTDGLAATKQTPQFTFDETDIERADFAHVAAPKILDPIDIELSITQYIDFERKLLKCYTAIIDDCLVTVRQAHINMFRHYFPDCSFKVDRQHTTGDRYRGKIQVFDNTGTWCGLVMPSLPGPQQVDEIKANI